METFVLVLIQVLAVIAIAPLYDGIVIKIRARLQSKQGSDIFQTYRDIFKLLKRNRTRPACSHWVFRSSPYILFGLSVAMLATMPITYGPNSAFAKYSDVFVFIYIAAAFRFIFGAASIDSGNPFASVGGGREQMIGIYVEPVMVICLLVVMLTANTSNLPMIEHLVRSREVGYHIPSFAVASIAFLWAMYVETGRKPYDLAEAEQELQEGLLGEYSGKDLVLGHMSLMIKQFSMIAFFLVVFEPWNFSNPILALIVFLLEAGCFYVGAVFIDNFGPRYKVTSSLRFNAFGVLMVSLVALVLYVMGV